MHSEHDSVKCCHVSIVIVNVLLFIPSIISTILSFAVLLLLLPITLFLIPPSPRIPSSPSFSSFFLLCSFSPTDSEHFHLLVNLYLRSSFHPTLCRDEKERVKSCFPAMRERVELSGCVWGGCDSVRNLRNCWWQCCPLCPDWCAVSSSCPGCHPWRRWVGVFALWHPSPSPLFNVHTHVQ